MDVRASKKRIARSGALLIMLCSVATGVDARGFGGGGGFRGGGSMSMSRGGSFGGHGSFGSGGYSRGSYSRSDSSGSRGFTRGGDYSRPSAIEGGGSGKHVDGGGARSTDFGVRSNPSARPGSDGSGTRWDAGNRPAQLPVTRPGQGGSGVQWKPVSRPGEGGSGTRWRPDCPKCDDGGNGWIDHPVAAGVVIGAVAGAAAAIGSAWYSLPADCPPYYWDSTIYYSCDGSYFLPQYEGDTVVYVTVQDPSGGQQAVKE